MDNSSKKQNKNSSRKENQNRNKTENMNKIEPILTCLNSRIDDLECQIYYLKDIVNRLELRLNFD